MKNLPEPVAIWRNCPAKATDHENCFASAARRCEMFGHTWPGPGPDDFVLSLWVQALEIIPHIAEMAPKTETGDLCIRINDRISQRLQHVTERRFAGAVISGDQIKATRELRQGLATVLQHPDPGARHGFAQHLCVVIREIGRLREVTGLAQAGKRAQDRVGPLWCLPRQKVTPKRARLNEILRGHRNFSAGAQQRQIIGPLRSGLLQKLQSLFVVAAPHMQLPQFQCALECRRAVLQPGQIDDGGTIVATVEAPVERALQPDRTQPGCLRLVPAQIAFRQRGHAVGNAVLLCCC